MADNEEESAQAQTDEQALEGSTEASLPEGDATATPTEGEAAPTELPGGEESAAKTEEEPSGTEPVPGAADSATTEPAAVDATEATPAEQAEGEAQAEGEESGEVTAAAEGGEGEKKEEAGEGETTEGEEGEQKEGEESGEEHIKLEGEGGDGEEGERSATAAEDSKERAEGEEGEGKKYDEEEEEGPKSPLPQSDSFGEGERPESSSGLYVGEKLSRSPTPTEDHRGQAEGPEVLEPGTPDRTGSAEATQKGSLEVFEEEAVEEEAAEEPLLYNRDELIERYHMALADRETLLQQNYHLQHKLAEHFRKKKNDERPDYDRNVTDQEQRYLKYMAQLDELHQQDLQERDDYQKQMEELKGRCEERRERVNYERRNFLEFKKQVALNSVNSRSGKPITPKDVEQYLITENKKEAEVVNVRLENIKLKNKLKKKEQQLKSKEELAEGLHLIDFEQLKIENQTYNEKIEERNEELLKLRKKITSTVQVLTHLKEKLQFVQGENQIHRGQLHEVEVTVAHKRDILSRTKQARDSLRIDNQKLRQNCGLLGNEALLRDFEQRKDEKNELKVKLEHLKMQHAELTLNCNQVRRKIEQARAMRQ